VAGNRIRYLHKDTFKKYTHLKHLYLDDNVIHGLENGTFAPLKELEVISLSQNALRRVLSATEVKKINFESKQIECARLV
jgi:hypothetical protein